MIFQHYNLGIFSLVTLYGMFTNHNPLGVATHCLLLELLDVSVSDLLVRVSNQGHSMWLIQHCARDVWRPLASCTEKVTYMLTSSPATFSGALTTSALAH